MAKNIAKELDAETISVKGGAVKNQTALGNAAKDKTAKGGTEKNAVRKMIPELSSLLQDVEKAYGRKIRTTTCLLYTSPSPRD